MAEHTAERVDPPPMSNAKKVDVAFGCILLVMYLICAIASVYGWRNPDPFDTKLESALKWGAGVVIGIPLAIIVAVFVAAVLAFPFILIFGGG